MKKETKKDLSESIADLTPLILFMLGLGLLVIPDIMGPIENKKQQTDMFIASAILISSSTAMVAVSKILNAIERKKQNKQKELNKLSQKRTMLFQNMLKNNLIIRK